MATQGMGMLDPTKTPSGMPPPGGLPNLVNPPSQAPIANAVVTVTLGLAMVFVALRLHIDVWISRKLEAAGCKSYLLLSAASIKVCHYRRVLIHLLGACFVAMVRETYKSYLEIIEAYYCIESRLHPYLSAPCFISVSSVCPCYLKKSS